MSTMFNSHTHRVLVNVSNTKKMLPSFTSVTRTFHAEAQNRSDQHMYKSSMDMSRQSITKIDANMMLFGLVDMKFPYKSIFVSRHVL